MIMVEMNNFISFFVIVHHSLYSHYFVAFVMLRLPQGLK